MDRVATLNACLDAAVDGARAPALGAAGGIPLGDGGPTPDEALALFSDQVTSRAIDVAARRLKAVGAGYYTISSAGHEMNAVVAGLLRTTDPALLHYRSGAFVLTRSRVASRDRATVVRDILLGCAASSDDPVSAGRHKVWGSSDDWIIPQTSTIASHLPKAVGVAFAIERTRRLGLSGPIPDDSIAVCSFGDASANHASALAGINAARYGARRGGGTPLLFVCEDNGLGISVPTPPRWIEESYSSLPHLRYVRAEGNLASVHAAADEAIAHVRKHRSPVFLHLPVVRLLGHAGSDVEMAYRSMAEIEEGDRRDPLALTARWLIEVGAAPRDVVRAIITGIRTDVAAIADEVIGAPTLATRGDVRASLTSRRGLRHRHDPLPVDADDRAEHFGGEPPEAADHPSKRTLASHINSALNDLMLTRPEVIVFGEDVGRKGGVYGVTSRLQQAFGTRRVFDTPLDETTILGIAQGAGLLGLMPIAEVQYLAYVHNAIDQLRGEAATMSFFSDGAYTNPMVVRIAGFAYQKGFGGHFHNDNAIGALREIPGIVVGVPSRGDDAAKMLRGAVALAQRDGRVVVIIEPIALYHEKDLIKEGDGGWLTRYPEPDETLEPGTVAISGPGDEDILIVSYGNGHRMSQRVAYRLQRAGARVGVADLRWLQPLPLDDLWRHAAHVPRVLVVDEARPGPAGVSTEVVLGMLQRGHRGLVSAVTSDDCFVPLGPAASHVLLGETEIEAAARSMLAR